MGMGMGDKEHHWDAKKMQKELGLTDDQTTKLQAIVDSEKTAMKTTMDSNRELMKKLEAQVKKHQALLRKDYQWKRKRPRERELVAS